MQPHKFVNINTYLPDDIPVDYVRVKYLYCGICGGDYSRYLGYRTEYPLSLGHEFVAQILDYNCVHSVNFNIGDFVVSDFNYRCQKCHYCLSKKAIYVPKIILNCFQIELFPCTQIFTIVI